VENKFNICYIIMCKNEGNSPFLSTSKYLLRKTSVLDKINNLPISIPELLCGKEEKLRIRLTNIYPGRIIHFIDDYNSIENLPYTFKVVFIDEEFANLNNKQDDILYVSISENMSNENVIFFEELAIDELRNFFFSKIFKLHSIYADISDEYLYGKIGTDINVDESIFTFCNIKTLESMNVDLKNRSTNNKEENRKNIEKSINIINYIKSKIRKNMKMGILIPRADYLISDFTIDVEYSINTRKYSKHNLRKSETKDCDLVHNSIIFAKNNTEIDGLHDNIYIDEYKSELYFNSLILSMYASSTLTPEIKIKICNNDLFTLVSDIGVKIRKQDIQKIQKMIKKFSNIVIEKSETMFDYFSDKLNNQIKIVSNFPLEWTNVNGLPLMIRHNVSRVFNSPGFIKQNILLNDEQFSISLDSFKKILVISSFKSGDYISNDIKRELNRVMGELRGANIKSLINEKELNENIYCPDFEIEIIFKDVTNKNELIDSLNSFNFPLVIFDMHGGHDSDGYGFLELAGEKLDPYELIGVANIPPIVVLSACDTSPADRNHFNVANAFLCAGAKTVLASTYPILSKDAAVYVGRLYKRLRLYLPERILSVERSLRWSEFITGLNRRVYFEYFLKYIFKKYKITDVNKLRKLSSLINEALENEPEHFLDGIFYYFEELTDLSRKQINDELSEYFLFAECMNYVQIGSPEKILIHAADMSV